MSSSRLQRLAWSARPRIVGFALCLVVACSGMLRLLTVLKLGTARDNNDASFIAVPRGSRARRQLEDFDPRNPLHGTLASDYECLGWYRTKANTPEGPRDPQGDRNCSQKILGGDAGYCVFLHKQQNQARRVLSTHADSLVRRPDTVWFTCNQAPDLLAYGDAALAYDPLTHVAPPPPLTKSHPRRPQSVERGVSIVVHPGVLASAYAGIRLLRQNNMTLPIEVWIRPEETDADHAILHHFATHHDVFVRPILDPRATQYYTKLYAVFFSAFDNVLFLDADNFAIKNPTYLFHTQQFLHTGAVFWPDFWQPRQSIFNMHKRSLLWTIIGVPFVDMFEQESGQILINRTRHAKALAALMHFGFSSPRLLDRLRLVWGDKDLFRLAWIKTNSSFHFIRRHAGSAGVFDATTNAFCGLTMVQHDPHGDIVFLHRNLVKLRAGANNKRVWTHIQQFRIDAPVEKYRMHGAKVEGFSGCWEIARGDQAVTSTRLVAEFPFRDVELQLLESARYAEELSQKPLGGKGRPTIHTNP